MKNQHQILLIILLTVIFLFVLIAIIIDGPVNSINGFLAIQISPARLVSDYMAIQGVGPAFLNASAVALIGLGCVLVSGISLSGVTFATVLTLLGFGLFGKTPVNILPIILGVFLAAKLAKKSFKDYIVIALFGTALGPIISFVAFEIGLSLWVALPLSLFIGLAAGFLLPSIAISMLLLHQGFNLYNIGLTCGFLGIFVASIFKVSKINFETLNFWYAENNIFLILIIPFISLILIGTALVIDKKKALLDFLKIMGLPGRLPSDFFAQVSLSGGLFNSGIIGLFGTTLIFLTGSQFNGPVIGGLLTIMGFGAFGTHFRNSWPVISGVIACALIFSIPLNSPSVILAILFCTTLAPLAGEFGIIIGFIAGFIHFIMVSQTGSWPSMSR